MTVLNNSISIGKETAYGTKVATTRAYEATADDWSREVTQIETDGFRRYRDTLLKERIRHIDLGATGSIPHAFLTRGEGLLLRACLPGGSDTATARKFTLNSLPTTPAAPPSYSVEVVRSMGSSMQGFQYTGCVVTGWELSVEAGGEVMFTPTFDCQAEDKQATPTAVTGSGFYPGGEPYLWEDCKISLDGADVAYISSFSLSADLGFKTDRRFLQQDANKAQPVRASTPTYTGELVGEFLSAGAYDKFAAGTLAKIELVATHPSLAFKHASDDLHGCAC